MRSSCQIFKWYLYFRCICSCYCRLITNSSQWLHIKCRNFFQQAQTQKRLNKCVSCSCIYIIQINQNVLCHRPLKLQLHSGKSSPVFVHRSSQWNRLSKWHSWTGWFSLACASGEWHVSLKLVTHATLHWHMPLKTACPNDTARFSFACVSGEWHVPMTLSRKCRNYIYRRYGYVI